MTDAELEWFAMKCQLAVLTKQGAAFQDFVGDLLEAVFPDDFQRVRPYGKQGDHKCDGLLASQGLVLQVYAPRQTKESVMVAKIKKDFAGARQHWYPDFMKGWVFVHNDPDGLPPGVTKLLATLAKEHPDLGIKVWGPGHLVDHAMSLPRAALLRLFGRPLDRRDFDQLGFAPVAEVLEAIARAPESPDTEIAPVSPSKLEHNALSAGTARWLTLGRQREHLVQQFIDRHPDPTLGEAIAGAFRAEYERLRALPIGPNQIFVRLQAFAGSRERGTPEHEAAVLAVMSYLFERCDIFESPPPVPS